MTPMEKPLKNPKLTLLLILLFSATIRFVGLGEKQLWLDELLQVVHSTPDSIHVILQGVAADRGSAPLDYIVQHYAMKAMGQRNDFSARLHSAVFGSASILLVYLIGLNLFRSRRTALLASALYGIYPLHHQYSQEGRPYAFFVFLVLVLFYLHQKFKSHTSWRLAALIGLLTIASFYTHPYTAMLIAVFISIDLLYSLTAHQNPALSKRLWVTIGAGALGTFAFIPWIVFSFHNAHGENNAWFGWRLLPDMIKALGAGSYPLSLLILSIAVFGVIRLKKADGYACIDLSCWMLVPIPIIFALLYWRAYFFNTRQLLFITPAIILCAAYGLNYLYSFHKKRFLLLLTGYACICFAVIALHFRDNRVDFRSVGVYLRQNAKSNDAIVAPYVDRLLSLYFPEISSYRQADRNGRIFVIDTLYADARDKKMIADLQNIYLRSERLEFRGINVSILTQASSRK
jgi:uncharacterized membrane protein